jgi:hypothetical protein
VHTDRGFVLHRPGGSWDSTHRISDNVQVTTSRDVLAAIARGEGPHGAFVALGYAGWDAGQLEREMLDNAWLSLPIDERIVFELPFEDRWQAAWQPAWAWTARASVSPPVMPEAQARVVLAFDFGLRRIGVASGDTVSNTAAPRGAVLVTDHGVDWPAIDRLLLRIPAAAAGGGQSPACRRHRIRLERARRAVCHRAGRSRAAPRYTAPTNTPPRSRPRPNSTSQRASGQRRRRVQHADIDSAAAAIILERWLRGEGRIDD